MIALDLELLDFTNKENVKQMIINNFVNNSLTLSKVKSVQDGFYIYHNDGLPHKRKVRTLIEDTGSKRVYARSYKTIKSSFIAAETEPIFIVSLKIAIVEAINRKG